MYNVLRVSLCTLLLAYLWMLVSFPTHAQDDNCSTVTDIPVEECKGLMALYDATGGDQWSENYGWNQDSTVCDNDRQSITGGWYGIDCWSGHVVNIRLRGLGLVGELPSEFNGEVLPFIRDLDLSNNKLTGPIPIFAASSLVYIDFSYNHFTGDLPSEYNSTTYPNLSELMLDDLQIEGFDPSFATLHHNFTGFHAFLSINYNKIDKSSLPISVQDMFDDITSYGTFQSNWDDLQYLPPTVTATAINSTSIRLDLGEVPLLSIGYYRPGDNYELLQSPNPTGGPYTRIALLAPQNNQRFYLMYNRFVAGQTYYYSARSINNAPHRPEIKASAYRDNNAVTVVSRPPVDCSDIATTGVPQLDCEALVDLYETTGGEDGLWYNRPAWGEGHAGWGEAANMCIGGWQGVRCENGRVGYLFLTAMNMTGDFPHSITQLTGLQGLFFAKNNLTGTLPDFSGMTHLYQIHLQNNHLTGGLPELPPSVGFINLSRNQLTGPIPASYGTQEFNGIFITGNMLFGDLPSGFGTNPSFNPGGVFSGVDLGYNALTASEPATIAFMNTANPTFFTTQTLPPSGTITATAQVNHSVRVGDWSVVNYLADEGYYEVGVSVAGGPFSFSFANRTTSKTDNDVIVNGLLPNVEYCFIVNTVTLPHGVRPPVVDYMTDMSTHNYNTVVSPPSTTPACITLPESSQPPTAPQTLSPLPAVSITGSNTPTFTWDSLSPVEGVTSYRLKIRDNATGRLVFNRRFMPETICLDGVCSVDINSLTRADGGLPNGQYSWQIAATNALGTTNTPRQGFTLTKPSAATLITPINNVILMTQTPTLEFFIPDGQAITTVTVKIYRGSGTTPRFKQTYPVAEICVGNYCSVTVTDLVRAGRYRWNVQVKNVNGRRVSEVGRFRLDF